VTYVRYMQRCASEYFATLLVKHSGSAIAVAKEAGIARSTVYRLMRQNDVVPKRPRIRGNREWQALL
jgi:transcriptional regulator of acetoin/glycerol metabolism